jgi:uncharacterized protein (TIGR04255 family)
VSNHNVKRRKYKKDFLDKVIVRIDFDTPLPIATTGPAKSIYTTVKERFPITEEKKVIGRELLIGPSVTKERSIETKEWHYYGKNREKHLTVSPKFMFIEYNKYEYYEMLRDDFLSVSNALFDAYPKLQVQRLGLRYIDNIKIPDEKPMEWDKYLKPELNSIFAIADNKNTISRVFHVLEFNYGEDSLRFQFGMFNPDYPAPIKKKIYTLDYDMYVTKILDKSDIEQTLDRFHEKVNQSFEEVITDELRKIMEPLDE